MKFKEKIAVIGGGTGIFPVLKGLKKSFPNISAIVSIADDGGSSGILREEFGILPPGDIRKALIALSPADKKTLAELFSFRFKKGNGLAGHNLGNLIITALERITKDFSKAIQKISGILNITGQVIPISLDKSFLYAKLENQKIIKGETNIDMPKHNGNLVIEDVWLKPKSKINPLAKKELIKADLIIIGPGDLYSSIIPNLLVKGVKEALLKSKAKIVYFVNLMTKFGETNNFSASDFLKTLQKYLGRKKVDYLIINNRVASKKILNLYKREKSYPVKIDLENIPEGIKVVKANLLREETSLIRHDELKTTKVILKILGHG